MNANAIQIISFATTVAALSLIVGIFCYISFSVGLATRDLISKGPQMPGFKVPPIPPPPSKKTVQIEYELDLSQANAAIDQLEAKLKRLDIEKRFGYSSPFNLTLRDMEQATRALQRIIRETSIKMPQPILDSIEELTMVEQLREKRKENPTVNASKASKMRAIIKGDRPSLTGIFFTPAEAGELWEVLYRTGSDDERFYYNQEIQSRINWDAC